MKWNNLDKILIRIGITKEERKTSIKNGFEFLLPMKEYMFCGQLPFYLTNYSNNFKKAKFSIIPINNGIFAHI